MAGGRLELFIDDLPWRDYIKEREVLAKVDGADLPPALDVLAVIYGAYLSAAEGRRVDLTPYLAD